MKTTKDTVIKSFLLGALLATTNTWTVIHAQEGSAALEEIIVTAQKRQENLQTLGTVSYTHLTLPTILLV